MTDNIPEEIRHLIPEPKKIVVGTEVVDLLPLPYVKWEEILTTLEKVIADTFNEEFAKALDDPKKSTDLIIGKVIDILKSNVTKILAIALGRKAEDIAGVITVPQITHIVRTIWEMNLKQPAVDIGAIVESFSSRAAVEGLSQSELDKIVDVTAEAPEENPGT